MNFISVFSLALLCKYISSHSGLSSLLDDENMFWKLNTFKLIV